MNRKHQWRRQVMPIKFSELPIPFGAVLIDNQLDALLSSGMSEDLMSHIVEEDWMVLV